jgi:DNA polymerase III subunit gamma/tau
MSYLVLARKHRPQVFEDVVGQEHVTQTLQNAIRGDRVAHALLFSGPRGVGKTSVARIMAKALNCAEGPTPSPCNACRSCKEITIGTSLDVFEIDGASNRGIDEIRELRENIKYMPSRSRFKIYIIDEVHMLTEPAFNALLKTLEEPPPHVLFFFATTEPHKIPLTILSRCQRHNFKRIGLEHVVAYLEQVSRKASFDISAESLGLLAHEAGGCMRDALSLLDQAMAYSETAISHEQVLEVLGAVDRKALFDLCGALLDGRIVSALNLLDDLYRQGHDLKRLYGQLLEHLRHLVIAKLNDGEYHLIEVPAHEIDLLKDQAERVSLETIHQIFSVAFEAESSIRFSTQPKIALEALFVKLLQLKNLVSLDQIIAGMDHLAKTSKRPADKPFPGREEPPPAPETTTRQDPPRSMDPAATEPERLVQTWKELLCFCDEQCKIITPLLENAFLSRIGKDFVEIAVAGNSFFSARLRDEKNSEKIRQVCSRFFGRPMIIRFTERQAATHAEANTNKDNDKTRRLRKEALGHPIVTDALDVFEGTVVDVKIL